MKIQQGGHEVNGLGQRASPGAGLTAKVRVVDEQRDVGDLVIARHDVLGPPGMLAQQESMVGGHDQGGVIPHVVGVHVIE